MHEPGVQGPPLLPRVYRSAFLGATHEDAGLDATISISL
jgi:hypothetical protein